MKKFVLFAAGLIAGIVCAGVAFFILRPVTVMNAMNRYSLVSGGLKKTKIAAPAGVQTAFIGGSGPVLVFLHGAGDTAGTWAKIAPAYTGDHRVVALDLAGHGESAPVDGPLSVKTMIESTEAVLAKVAPQQDVTLIGNSMGAWIAFVYAQRHPERVTRIIAINGGPARANRPDVNFVPATRQQARSLFDEITSAGGNSVPGFVLDDIVRKAQTGPLARLARTAAEMPPYLIEGEKLRSIDVPVDFLWGAADKVFTVEYANKLAAELPAARVTQMPKCGHVPQVECPVAFAHALKKILATMPPVQSKPRDEQTVRLDPPQGGAR